MSCQGVLHIKRLDIVQVGYANERSAPISKIAICAGSGGSMLLGTPADVYFTGEMSHVMYQTFFFETFLITCLARSSCCHCCRQARHLV